MNPRRSHRAFVRPSDAPERGSAKTPRVIAFTVALGLLVVPLALAKPLIDFGASDRANTGEASRIEASHLNRGLSREAREFAPFGHAIGPRAHQYRPDRQVVLLCFPGEITNTALPTISGPSPAYVGNTLTTTNGSWTSCFRPITGYHYEWLRNGGVICQLCGWSYTVQVADIGQTIRSGVEACNSEGCGGYYQSSNAIVPANRAPSAPSNLSPASGTLANSTAPTLSGTYSDPDGQTGYISYDVYSGGVWRTGCTGPSVASGSASSCGVSGLVPGTTYTWYATAHDASGATAQSNATYRVNAPPANPTALTPIDGTKTPSASPRLSATYNDPEALTGYVVFSVKRASDGVQVVSGQGMTVASGGTSNWTVTSGALEAGGVYRWYAYSRDSLGLTSGTVGGNLYTLDPQPAATTSPSFDGPAVVGDTMTGNAGAWASAATPTLSYQWQNCKPAAYSATVLADNPVGYWRVGETSGSIAADTSASGLNGTYTGGVSLGAAGALNGDSNNAASFDGVDDYVDVPDSTPLRLTGSVTVEVWVKTNGPFTKAYQHIAGKGDTSYVLQRATTTRAAAFSIYQSGAWTTVSGSTIIDDSQWHHVVGVYNQQALTSTLYVDGQQEASAPAPSAIASNTYPFRIGENSQATGRQWKGAIDEVAIYSTALTASRIQAHYQAGAAYADSVEGDAPAAYWRLGESSGTSASDGSGNGNAGTYAGSPTLGAQGLIARDADTSPSFDGANDRVGSSLTTGTGSFTYELWYRRKGTSSAQQQLLGALGGPYLIIAPGSSVAVFGFANAGSKIEATSVHQITDGTVHHLVGTWDGSKLRLYLDGSQVSSLTTTLRPVASAAGLSMGAASDSTQFASGTLDEIAYYTKALSAARVKAHYDAGARCRDIIGATAANYTPTTSEDAANLRVRVNVTSADGTGRAVSALSPAIIAAGAPDQPYPDVVLSDAPLGYWRLADPAGSTNAADTSGHALTGSYRAGVTPGADGMLPTIEDTAADFPGTAEDQDVYLGPVVGLDFSAGHDFSVEAWVTPKSGTSERTIVAMDSGVAPFWQIAMSNDPGFEGLVKVQIDDGYQLTAYGPRIRLDDGGWHHVVVVFRRSASISVFVDRVEALTTGSGAPGPMANTAPLRIGDSPRSPTFSGGIAEVAGYGSALATARIRAHYGASFARAEQFVDEVNVVSPAGYWRLGESAGSSTAVDSSESVLNGTYTGVTLGVPGALADDADTAASFGTGMLTIPSAAAIDFGTSDFTAAAWVKTTGAGTIMNQGQPRETQAPPCPPAPPWWELSIASGGRVVLEIDDGTLRTSEGCQDAYVFNGPSVSINDNAWHLVIAAVERNWGVRIYVDGVEQATGHAFTGSVGTNSLAIGHVFPGTLDEVSVYRSALNPEDMANLHEAGIAPPLASSEPKLSAADRDRASQIATADARVATLTSGRGSAVTDVTPWVTSSGALLGAEVAMTWATPDTIVYDWPEILADNSETTWPPYQTLVQHFSASSVSGLQVLVDLNCGVVVSIGPDDDSDIDPASHAGVSGPIQPAPCSAPPAGYFGGVTMFANLPLTPDGGRPRRTLRPIKLAGDVFYNYDFDFGSNLDCTQRPRDCSRRIRSSTVQTYLDWPVTLIFHDSAFYPIVYNNLRLTQYNAHGNILSGLIKVRRGYNWRRTDGRKKGPGCGRRVHFRPYAINVVPSDFDTNPGGVPRPNPTWGFWIPATTHLDQFEDCDRGEKWSGHSERAEATYVRDWKAAWGPVGVKENAIKVRNREHFQGPGQIGRAAYKKADNKGKASTIRVCAHVAFNQWIQDPCQ